MAYKEITKENAGEYVLSKTDIFSPSDTLSVYEFGENQEEDGDGFVNFVYRVWNQDGKSVIVKQAKEHLKKIRDMERNPISQDRNLTEASVMNIKRAIVPDYIPEIYYVDTENHAYIAEDASDLRVLRFELMRGEKFEGLGEKIGEFLAKTNFYTSEIYMDAVAHRELQTAFMNPSMRLVFEIGLFLKDHSAFTYQGSRVIPEGTPEDMIAMSEYPWRDDDFRTQLLRLRQLHMKKCECLVHGDLHTSNILVDQKNMKIIDQEYTYMGLASCDTGYLMGSMMYEYIRWFYMPEVEEGSNKQMRDYVLDLMLSTLESYHRIYAECWDKDAKEMYRPYISYRESILREFMNEVCGATGAQIISRVGGFIDLADFDTIEDEIDRKNARRIAMWTAKYLITNWERCNTPKELIDMIVKSVDISQKTIELFK